MYGVRLPALQPIIIIILIGGVIITLRELIAHIINFITQDDQENNAYSLDTLENSPNYMAFVKNALPEINRAIQEISSFNKFPIQVLEINTNKQGNDNVAYVDPFERITYSGGQRFCNVNLTKEENNAIKSIFKVEVEDYSGNLYSPIQFSYIRNKNTIKIPSVEGIVSIYYYPKIRLLTYDKDLDIGNEDGYIENDNSTELNDLGITDDICHTVIPYLVKAVMWQEIEPELAQLERNKGLQNLSLLPDGAENVVYQTDVIRTNYFD